MAEEYIPDEDDRIARPPAGGTGRRGRRVMTALIALAAVLGFGVVLVYAYHKGREDGQSATPPVIQAQEGPMKVRPENPGGMKVPDRDKEVFSRLEGENQPESVERLLPPPEKPMAAPEPAPEAEEATRVEPAAGTEPDAESVPETLAEAPAGQPDAVPAPTSDAAEPTTDSVVRLAEPPAPPEPEPAVTAPPPKPAPAPEATPVPRPSPRPEPSDAAASRPSGQSGSKDVYRIQISSLRSEEAVRRGWSRLSKQHADLLGKLSLNIERKDLGGGKGVYYRMQAGPLASRTEANSLCSRLKQRKLGCIVVRP